MRNLLVSFALGAAVMSSAALAQEQGGGWNQRDQTRAEVQQRADMMFQMIDANHDGVVTRAEAEQAAANFGSRGGGEARGGGRMQRLIDQAFGSAQSLNRQQLEAMMLQRFDAQDLNHDGVVTAAEREQARTQRGGAPGMPGAVPPPPPADVPPPPPGQ